MALPMLESCSCAFQPEIQPAASENLAHFPTVLWGPGGTGAEGRVAVHRLRPLRALVCLVLRDDTAQLLRVWVLEMSCLGLSSHFVL